MTFTGLIRAISLVPVAFTGRRGTILVLWILAGSWALFVDFSQGVLALAMAHFCLGHESKESGSSDDTAGTTPEDGAQKTEVSR